MIIEPTLLQDHKAYLTTGVIKPTLLQEHKAYLTTGA